MKGRGQGRGSEAKAKAKDERCRTRGSVLKVRDLGLGEVGSILSGNRNSALIAR